MVNLLQSFKGLMNILVYVSVINLKSCSDVGVISFDYRRLVSLATGRKLWHGAHIGLLLHSDEGCWWCVCIIYVYVFDLIH